MVKYIILSLGEQCPKGEKHFQIENTQWNVGVIDTATKAELYFCLCTKCKPKYFVNELIYLCIHTHNNLYIHTLFT